MYPEIFKIVQGVFHKVLALRWTSVGKHQDVSEFLHQHRSDFASIFPIVHIDSVVLFVSTSLGFKYMY